MILKKFFLPAVLLTLSFPLLRARWSWEKDPVVTLCADGAELESFYPDEALPGALRRLSAAGVRSVAVFVEEDEDAREVVARWARLLPLGAGITLRPSFRKISEGGRPWAPARITAAGDAVRCFLPAGTALPFPGADSPLHSVLEGTSWLFPWVEFSRAPALSALAKSFPERVVRAHAVDEEEMLRLSPSVVSARLHRAVRERGVRFLYIRFFPGLSPEGNISYVERLCAALRRDGFIPGEAAPRFPSAPRGLPGTALPQLLAFLTAVLGPWLAFRACLRFSGPFWARPAALTLLSLTTALLVSAALSSGEFLLGLAAFRGVKAALALPLLLAAGDLYRREEAFSFLRRPVTFGSAALAAALALAAAVYLLRSGNDSGLEAPAVERRVRDALEVFFGARPRFKEFAIGHPFLWMAAYLDRRPRKMFDTRFLWLVGMIAPLSIVNTFCHAHVPLAVSLLRTFHGFWLGSATGLMSIALLSRFRSASTPR